MLTDAVIDALDHTLVVATFDVAYILGGSPSLTAHGTILAGEAVLDPSDTPSPTSIQFQTVDLSLLIPGTFELYFVNDVAFPGRTIVLPISVGMHF